MLLSSRFRQGIAHDGHASLRDLRRTARTPNLWAKDRALKVAQGWTDDLSRRAAGVLRLPPG